MLAIWPETDDGADVELLTILYALLAAVTGIAGGDRALVAQQASVMVASAPCAELDRRFAVVAPVATQRPLAAVARVWLGDSITAPQPAAPMIAFNIAGFANRRE